MYSINPSSVYLDGDHKLGLPYSGLRTGKAQPLLVMLFVVVVVFCVRMLHDSCV